MRGSIGSLLYYLRMRGKYRLLGLANLGKFAKKAGMNLEEPNHGGLQRKKFTTFILKKPTSFKVDGIEFSVIDQFPKVEIYCGLCDRRLLQRITESILIRGTFRRRVQRIENLKKVSVSCLSSQEAVDLRIKLPTGK